MGDRTCPPKVAPACPPTSCPQKDDATEEVAPATDSPTTDAPVERVCKEFWSPGFDARFPNQNQTMRCWVNFVDYIRCQAKYGEDYEPCEYFRKTYECICPGFWIEKWNDQKESGTFPMPRWA